MPEPPTVYITNKSESHDYTSATKYGAIRYVTIGNYPVFKTNRLNEEIINVLAESSPNDFLLLSGSSIIAALSMAIWLEIHGQVKFLLWDRARGEYVQRDLDRTGLRMEIEKTRDRLTQWENS